MIPIQNLFSRIRWDPEFAQAEFDIGYYDRIEHRVILVAFQDLRFDPGDHFSFRVMDNQEQSHTIPFHRVREVYRNGRLIWSRASGGATMISHQRGVCKPGPRRSR